MKKQTLFSGLVFSFVLAGFLAQAQPSASKGKVTYPMPVKVQAVFENKCYGCHNDESRSDKAKDGLNFSTLEQLDKMKKIATFGDVKKEVAEGEMPPKKFLEKHPEAALSKEESKILVDWVKKESVALAKK